jgi:hypothetical protein
MLYAHTFPVDLAMLDETDTSYSAMPDAADYPSLVAYIDAIEEWDLAMEADAYCDARYDGLVVH